MKYFYINTFFKYFDINEGRRDSKLCFTQRRIPTHRNVTGDWFCRLKEINKESEPCANYRSTANRLTFRRRAFFSASVTRAGMRRDARYRAGERNVFQAGPRSPKLEGLAEVQGETHLLQAVESAEALGAAQGREGGVVPAAGAAVLQVVRLRRVQAVGPALAPALVQQMLRPGLPHGRRRVVLRVALHLPARGRLEAPPRARRRGHRRGEPLHEGAEHGHHRSRGAGGGSYEGHRASVAGITDHTRHWESAPRRDGVLTVTRRRDPQVARRDVARATCGAGASANFGRRRNHRETNVDGSPASHRGP